MDFTNDLTVSSKTKYYFIVSSNPSSEVFLILNDMIHFIERIIRLASCSEETKQNLIFCIYYSLDKLLIRDYSKWSILNIAFLILNLCILGQVIDTLASIIGSESIGHDYPFVRVDSIYLAIITLLCWRIANIIIGNTLEGTAVHSHLVVQKV